MEKALARAYEKLEKREHMLRLAIDRRGLKRLTIAEFKAEEKAILERYALTEAEQSAYEFHRQVTEQRKRRA